MTALRYEDIALSWKPTQQRDTLFSVLSALTFITLMILGLIFSSIHIPKKPRDRHVPVPERIAKFISTKPKPRVIPKPVEQPKPLPIPKQFIKPRKQVDRKPLTKVQKSARKKAEKSGLLALTRQLSGLVDTKNVNKLLSTRLHETSKQHQESGVSSDVLTAESGSRHLQVNQSINSAGASAGTVLDDNQRQLAMALLASGGKIAENRRNVKSAKSDRDSALRGENLRSEEDVAFVMDEHKNMLHRLYRRARRQHPDLKGKIVFEITILPSGRVSKVIVLSSELHDKRLEADLAARIRLFDFGSKTVQTLTVTVPVEFLPS